ncbi:MAG: phosphoribosylamine--glycine ligase [Verrucomicrobiae bacterium]|nr:phosphoribosylamine--glycine ligase [Verrucomicrobiae bacterium]
MNVLVIGGGGREHALVWKLKQSDRVRRIWCAPGNAGIAELAECVPIAATDIEKLATFASEHRVDLTVVGPEAPLCAGVVDVFAARGLRIFGPTRAAAQLEGSKAFCKQLLLEAGVPTAAAQIFSDAAAARAHVRKQGAPIVVKADGLAAGKGVVVAGTVAEAEQAITDIMERRVFGAAGERVVIEECLGGEEASVMALTDGQTYRLLAPAQDHKRVFDGDRGPNTGGMGAYSPAPVVSARWEPAIHEIFQRTLAGLRARGITYRGVLYAGLMMTAEGPKVLEFNCRFGDPETQVVLPRLDSDLVEVLEACVTGTLSSCPLRWHDNAAVCVVMAAAGYPGEYRRGDVIEGLPAVSGLANVCVFHAGTKRDGTGRVVTDGGRVLGVTAWEHNLAAAVARAYRAVAQVRFAGAQYRRDIAARALSNVMVQT